MDRPSSSKTLAFALTTAFTACGPVDPLDPEELDIETPALVTPGTILVDARFDSGSDGFAYRDDTFRGTTQPGYASGSHVTSGGASGGALRVRLGGIDNNDITGMSGGWRRTFTLAEPAKVTLAFKYKVVQTPNYEADEFSQIMATIDGQPLGHFPGADHFVNIAGDGDGGPNRVVDWHAPSISLGVLAAGTHTLIFGGYNNKKTDSNESTDSFIDEVKVVAWPAAPVKVIEASFNSGADGFSYLDDQFKGTASPAYASGAHSATGGHTGGALTVRLGGIDNTQVLGMSGGWRKTFTIQGGPAQVKLTFRYNLAIAASYEADEFAQVNASINGDPFGTSLTHDNFVTFAGGVGGGAIGWHAPTTDFGTLPPGTYSLVFGGYNNKKTGADESSLISVDDIVVTATY